jgi:hypothetical protein
MGAFLRLLIDVAIEPPAEVPLSFSEDSGDSITRPEDRVTELSGDNVLGVT